MSLDVQDLIDRRRLRAKLGFWRLAALVILALAVLAVPVARLAGGEGGLPGRESIARVEISGLITEDRRLLALLNELKEDDSVRAVLLKINSPGGTTVGGESLYQAARDLAAKKPVVAEVGTLAASAGYMVAAGSDRIVARHSSIVGSIGVIFQYVDASDLLGRVGVDVNAIKSTPLKAEPSPFAPTSEEARQMIARLVDSTYEWFVALVAERRGFSPAEMQPLADGSIFTGDQGLALGLVDEIGGEAEIRRWLEEERGVPQGLRIVRREPEREGSRWNPLTSARASFFAFLGLDPQAESLPEALARSAGQLDGLLSLWQPPLGR
ncbi:signal peptide peptidase SppA [Aureimonas populi]|uniref:Signal peptide peptidase SppA n=1 Tax=Aureimonas populi TaxID=1701758 RepID=A0ABW5CNC5_9HYPH|nr:signal peptide peptidase SppA [Aureimonas populi]